MTPPDPLETRLAETPHHGLPPALRGRILAAAREREPRDWRHGFGALLWPHPAAWGTVAAAWVVIAVLNFTGPRGPELYAVTPKESRGHLPTAQEYLVRMDAERRFIPLLSSERTLDFTDARRPRYYNFPRPQDL